MSVRGSEASDAIDDHFAGHPVLVSPMRGDHCIGDDVVIGRSVTKDPDVDLDPIAQVEHAHGANVDESRAAMVEPRSTAGPWTLDGVSSEGEGCGVIDTVHRIVAPI